MWNKNIFNTMGSVSMKWALALLGSIALFSPQALATDIYRSIGSSAAIDTGTVAKTLTIDAAGNVTFATAPPTRTGVGDAIQYDTNNNSTIEAVCFIDSRLTATTFTCKNAAGGLPTASQPTTRWWGLYRAYTSTAAFSSYQVWFDENNSLDNAIENFDDHDANGNHCVNLVGTSQTWHLAVYGDADIGGGYTADGTCSGDYGGGFTNSNATYYLHVFAPSESNQVGVSQRHSGVWDDTKARFGIASFIHGFNNTGNSVDNAIFEGLQFKTTAAVNAGSPQGAGIKFNGTSGSGSVIIRNNIFRQFYDNNSECIVDLNGTATDVYQVYNNIFYSDDPSGANRVGRAVWARTPGTLHLYNNTMYGLTEGVRITGGSGVGTYISRNNLVFNMRLRTFYDMNADTNADFTRQGGETNNYFSASSSNNYTDSVATDWNPPGTTTGSATPVFVDAVAAGGLDFHLASTDTVAFAHGANLSGIGAGLQFNYDIEWITRGTTWCAGADEYIPPNDVTVSNLVTSNVTISGFDAQITFAGDANADAACTFYYCNDTDSSSCVPTSGTSAAMTRGSGVFTVSVSGLTNPNNPGDAFNIRATCTDTDGVTGSPLNSTVSLAAGGANAIVTSMLATSGISTTAFSASINFTGDSNANAACTLYYCDNTASPACSALAGSSGAMTRGAGSFTIGVSGLTPHNPGHQYNLRAVCSDADGASGDLTNTVTLSSDTLSPKAPDPLTIE